MSAIKRWYIGVFGGEAQAGTCSPAEFEIIHSLDGRYFVLDEDCDRVTAERDALQLRLNAADQRIDELTGAAKKARDVLRDLLRDKGCGTQYAAAQMACHQINAALATEKQ